MDLSDSPTFQWSADANIWNRYVFCPTNLKYIATFIKYLMIHNLSKDYEL